MNRCNFAWSTTIVQRVPMNVPERTCVVAVAKILSFLLLFFPSFTRCFRNRLKAVRKRVKRMNGAKQHIQWQNRTFWCHLHKCRTKSQLTQRFSFSLLHFALDVTQDRCAFIGDAKQKSDTKSHLNIFFLFCIMSTAIEATGREKVRQCDCKICGSIFIARNAHFVSHGISWVDCRSYFFLFAHLKHRFFSCVHDLFIYLFFLCVCRWPTNAISLSQHFVCALNWTLLLPLSSSSSKSLSLVVPLNLNKSQLKLFSHSLCVWWSFTVCHCIFRHWHSFKIHVELIHYNLFTFVFLFFKIGKLCADCLKQKSNNFYSLNIVKCKPTISEQKMTNK